MGRESIGIVDFSTTFNDRDLDSAEALPQQLSLFDCFPQKVVTFMSMHEMHGSTFFRVLDQADRPIIIDIRGYPFFDMGGVRRDIVSSYFARNNYPYKHAPISMIRGNDSRDRWNMRSKVVDIFKDMDRFFDIESKFALMLVDNFEDALMMISYAKSIDSISRDYRFSVVR
ncbi:hypothetical protein [uncultured Bosea sp.]|uniref:hypothetical protein n=1 Tax=uncultured Bosea sp. TaxID=211457 RepID=UPI0025F18B28|nr:hypothetical protein [uncultured Bosea sp.]